MGDPHPRRRTEQVRDAVLTAAGELMLEGGLAAATMEAIAARAGVSKRTLYKYWPSRGAVALEGFMRSAAASWTLPENAPAAESLEELVVAAVRLFTQTPAGPLMRSLIADAQAQDEIATAIRDQWLRPRRAQWWWRTVGGTELPAGTSGSTARGSAERSRSSGASAATGSFGNLSTTAW